MLLWPWQARKKKEALSHGGRVSVGEDGFVGTKEMEIDFTNVSY